MDPHLNLPLSLRHLEGRDNRNVHLVVVIPVARCEWHLAVKLLKWIDALGGINHPLVILCAPGVTLDECLMLEDAGSAMKPEIHQAKYKDTGYFGGANSSFRSALDYCEKNHPGKAMLWVEADCVPMRSPWVDEILDEYRGCGQPFMGDVHLCAINHLTGNSVYAPEWRHYAPAFNNLPGPDPEWGWDSQCADDTLTRAHRAKTIQQIWRPPLPITAAWMAKNIRSATALFHQCKDGSLIDVLCDKAGIPRIPIAPARCASTYETQKRKPVPAPKLPSPPAIVTKTPNIPKPREVRNPTPIPAPTPLPHIQKPAPPEKLTRVQQVHVKHAAQPPRFDRRGRRVG